MSRITMAEQGALMRFDPATGAENPYPSHAGQWREHHGHLRAWLFNPWTGEQRSADDVGSDTTGLLIQDGSRHPGGGMKHFKTAASHSFGLRLEEMGVPLPHAAWPPQPLTTCKCCASLEGTTIAIPKLSAGEKYAGIIFETGGDLPSPREMNLLAANLPDEFKNKWYWSSRLDGNVHDGYWAWCHDFDSGRVASFFGDNTFLARNWLADEGWYYIAGAVWMALVFSISGYFCGWFS